MFLAVVFILLGVWGLLIFKFYLLERYNLSMAHHGRQEFFLGVPPFTWK
jgi:hypothetical protein